MIESDNMENRTCTKCQVTYPATTEYFYTCKGGKYGLASQCKSCKAVYFKKYQLKNRDSLAKRQKIYNRSERGKAVLKKAKQKYNRRIRYGMSIETYDRMVLDQDGRCAICRRHQSELKCLLSVDHNHVTDQIRGLLCDECNLGLGKFKVDSGDFYLQKALQYLKLCEALSGENMLTLQRSKT